MLDLFGTLVDAPTRTERARAAARLAGAIGCPTPHVEDYLRTTWRVRHDGTLPTVANLAEHLVRTVGGCASAIERVGEELRGLGHARLATDTTVMQALSHLRSHGLRLGMLSDASAEIADAWPTGPLSTLIDFALFSCNAGFTKPDPRLFARVCGTLGVTAQRTLYVGDGGGGELPGARACGMSAVAVRRRGSSDSLAFGSAPWTGPVIDAVEQLPAYLADIR